MKALLALFLKEVRSQVASPVAWTVGAGFLLLSGYFFFNLVSQFAVMLRSYTMYAQIYQNPSLLDRVNLNEMVVANLLRNLLVLFLFITPVLTMRSFAEERKQGTDELLLTAPVTPGQIVAGKLLGLLAITLALVVASGLFVLILFRYADPEAGPVWTGFLGLVLAGSALAALGLAVSSATDSQVVSGVGSFVLFLMLFVIDWPAESVGGRLGAVLKALSLPEHFEGFTKGLVTSPDILYYLSLVAIGVFTARAILASQRWR
jgi:ABC-2 type transport system permease protein